MCEGAVHLSWAVQQQSHLRALAKQLCVQIETCAKSQEKAVTCVLQINFIQFFWCPSIYIYLKQSFRNSGPYPFRFLYMPDIWTVDVDCWLWRHLEYYTCMLLVMLHNSWLQGWGAQLFLWAAAHFRIACVFKRKICDCFEHIKARTLWTFSSCILVFRIQSLCTGMFSGHMVGLPLIVSSINCRTISSLSIDLAGIWWWEVEAEITQEKWHFSNEMHSKYFHCPWLFQMFI